MWVKCDWSKRKNEINKRRHGLSFEFAEIVLDDPYAVSFDDFIDDYGDQRYQTFAAYEGVLYQIAHIYIVMNGVEMPRLISFRKATDYEQENYFERR